MGLRGFERRLERMVEGVFARAFRSALRPVEIGRRLIREMDDRRTVDVRGRTVVPNAFTVTLSPTDLDQLAGIDVLLIRELCDAAREYARDEGYAFLGPVTVGLARDDKLVSGSFRVEARFAEGPGGSGAGSLLLPSGERVVLGESVCVLGRLPESTVVLADPNASRRHAEIHPDGDGFRLVDLGSMNGTRVNGVVVAEHRLRDGDEITIGGTRIRFEAS